MRERLCRPNVNERLRDGWRGTCILNYKKKTINSAELKITKFIS